MEMADWELVRKRTYWNLHVIKWLVHQSRPCLRAKVFSCEAGGNWTSGKGQEINDAIPSRPRSRLYLAANGSRRVAAVVKANLFPAIRVADGSKQSHGNGHSKDN